MGFSEVFHGAKGIKQFFRAEGNLLRVSEVKGELGSWTWS